MVAIQIEDHGFCQKGEVGAYLASDTFPCDGTLPLNTDGGQLSCGQAGIAGGRLSVTEAVRQLRGEGGARSHRRASWRRVGLRHGGIRPRTVGQQHHSGSRSMSETVDYPKPHQDEDNRPFLEGWKEGRLRLQRSRSGGPFFFYPRPICPFTGSRDLIWVDASRARSFRFRW